MLKIADKVTWLPTPTTHDIPADKMIDSAKDQDLKGVVVIGWDKDGEFYFASSFADGGDALWLIEQAKLALLSNHQVAPRGK